MKTRFIFKKKTPAQAMVEFALVLPILLLVIYGLLEVGRLLFIYSSVVTAARSAARYGSTTGLNVAGGVPRYRDCAGMRSAAKRAGFIDRIEDADITIQHDRGEGVNVVNYCPPGATVDTTNFQPTAGNIDRVRVTVNTDYSPILSFLPLEPFLITSTSARTILVSVPVQITAAPQTWAGQPSNTPLPTPTFPPTNTFTPPPTSTATATGTITQTPTISQTPTITGTPTKTGSPTNTGTATHTGTPTGTATATGTPFTCVVKHSALKTNPAYTMTIFNDSVGATIHVSQIQITWNTQGNQELQGIILGGANVWTGAQLGSPSVITAFTGNLDIAPGASKLLQFEFLKPYNTNGNEQIVVTFAESSCPLLDSSNLSQLK